MSGFSKSLTLFDFQSKVSSFQIEMIAEPVLGHRLGTVFSIDLAILIHSPAKSSHKWLNYLTPSTLSSDCLINRVNNANIVRLFESASQAFHLAIPTGERQDSPCVDRLWQTALSCRTSSILADTFLINLNFHASIGYQLR